MFVSLDVVATAGVVLMTMTWVSGVAGPTDTDDAPTNAGVISAD